MAELQRVYNTHQQGGLPGKIERGVAYDVDSAQTNAATAPGRGVYRNSNGEWIEPTDAATGLLVTHITTFEEAVVNTAITSPTTNQNSEVTFAADELVTAIAYGRMWVVAGEDVTAGDLATFDGVSKRWDVLSITAGTVTTFPSAMIEFLDAGANGDVVRVRHYGRNPR